jgi:hypothetical protein
MKIADACQEKRGLRKIPLALMKKNGRELPKNWYCSWSQGAREKANPPKVGGCKAAGLNPNFSELTNEGSFADQDDAPSGIGHVSDNLSVMIYRISSRKEVELADLKPGNLYIT